VQIVYLQEVTNSRLDPHTFMPSSHIGIVLAAIAKHHCLVNYCMLASYSTFTFPSQLPSQYIDSRVLGVAKSSHLPGKLLNIHIQHNHMTSLVPALKLL